MFKLNNAMALEFLKVIKNMSRLRFVMMFLAVFCFVGTSVVAAPAHAGWLEFFFPELKKKEYDPWKTMKAPFADPDAVVDSVKEETGLGENSVPLEMPHRADAVITTWVEQNISDLLTYDAATYGAQYKEKAKVFNKDGLQEYVKFLNSQNIVTSLKSGQYDVRSFVQDVPIIVNKGDVDGHYQWLYQIKVMVSFVKVGLKSYKDIKGSDEISREFVLNVHVGRSESEVNDLGLLLEGWDGKLQTKEE